MSANDQPQGKERREAIQKAEKARDLGKPNPTRYSVWRATFDPPKPARWSGERYEQPRCEQKGRER